MAGQLHRNSMHAAYALEQPRSLLFRANLALLVICLFTLDYLTQVKGVLPRATNVLTDFTLASAAIIAVLTMSRHGKVPFDGRYWLLMSLALALVLAGWLINGVPTGGIIVGLRIYLKCAMAFLVGVVLARDINAQRLLFGALALGCLLQTPLAVVQRVMDLRGTGDNVRGTMETSSTLSVVMMAALAVVTARYWVNLTTTRRLVILGCWLFLPTLLNETKGTVVLLPLALVVPAFLLAHSRVALRGVVLRVGASVVGLWIVFALAYSVVAEVTNQNRTFMDYFSSETLTRYLAPRTSGIVQKELGEGPTGRLDKLVAPIDFLEDRGVPQLVVGLGIGNVSRAPVKGFSGDFSELRQFDLVGGGLSLLLWETGIFGVGLMFALLLVLFMDAFRLSTASGAWGAFGASMGGLIAIYAFGLIYKNFFEITAISALFFLFSGMLCAAAWEQRWSTSRRGLRRLSS